MRSFVKKFIKGVAWQNPAINLVLKVVDPIDAVLCKINGNGGLPNYSIRIRSNGINGQLGGSRFAKNGRVLQSLLQQHCDITPASDILEIGCGCGRTAISLSEYLESGSFVGMDIEQSSLNSCKSNKVLQRNGFKFDFLDVQNDEFNPNGKHKADEYRFPYDDNSFDTIFLVSVFTHMLTDDVTHYIDEISRLLKPGGCVFITTFLMDGGTESEGLNFPFKSQEHFYATEEMPEIAVGFLKSFYDTRFLKNGLTEKSSPVMGRWRNPQELNNIGDFSQDIVLYQKPQNN